MSFVMWLTADIYSIWEVRGHNNNKKKERKKGKKKKRKKKKKKKEKERTKERKEKMQRFLNGVASMNIAVARLSKMTISLGLVSMNSAVSNSDLSVHYQGRGQFYHAYITVKKTKPHTHT